MSTAVDFRVTSVYQYDKKWVCFSGVPLQNGSFKAKSAKYIIVVKTKPNILPMEPVTGQHWRITGEMVSRKATHGDFVIIEQHFIEPDKLEVTLPHDGESFIRFIAKESAFKGIGEVKARELWTAFGSGIYNILGMRNTSKLSNLLTTNVIESLFDGYEKYANLRYATWFSDRKIPPQIQQRLFKFHQGNSIEAIKDNPYHLISFGMSFDQVDHIAQVSFNVTLEDDRRLIAAVEFALKKHAKNGGHTVAYQNEIKSIVYRLLKNSELTNKAMICGHSKQTYIFNSETGSYHHTSLLIMEKVVAKRLLKLTEKNISKTNSDLTTAYHYATQELPFPLAEKQVDAVRSSLERRVSCITGGAGTGKTTVLRTVLRGYHALEYEIKAIALSGRAAMRLHQSIGFETSTIAKFLRDDPIEDDAKCIVVIDEASMVDLGTMYRIVLHTNPSIRFLFVGDPNQLPPIGAGLILADIVKSGLIATTELDIVQRQDAATGIPEYSRLVCQGQVPSELSIGNIHFHEVPLDFVTDTCVELYSQNPSESRVIAATKKTTLEVNTQCQTLLNATSPVLQFTEYGDHFTTDLRLNDPVLFTQNNYEAGVQNGSIGKLISIEQTETSLGIVRLDDNGVDIPLTKSLLDSLDAGYCITLHKAQGSQFKRVIVALGKTKMQDRAWIYTAITRSELELHIVGTRDRFEQAIRSLSAHHIRKTYLATLLK
ncbi:AAA family ATPase [uncultured Psychromonas sp.]|uniref:AAA family ATPase n=1 Tax=uncultured Psychromonas sp. TaxID=173974 RepID=UPI002606BFD5|nr:AAA family ATPase [uncultured Psychromonas sp.]